MAKQEVQRLHCVLQEQEAEFSMLKLNNNQSTTVTSQKLNSYELELKRLMQELENKDSQLHLISQEAKNKDY